MDPITPCVLLAPVKHVIILATLKRLAQGDIFTSKEVEQALGRIQWATSACPLTKPFLQPFWSWKKACTTSGRPPKLVRALAILLKKLFNQRFPLASPFAPTLPWTGASDAGAGKQADHAWVGGWCSDVPNPDKSRVKWFQHRITPEGEQGCLSSPVQLCRGHAVRAHSIDPPPVLDAGHLVFPVFLERRWALVTSALRMMKVSPCVGGCHVRGSPLLPPGRSVPGGVGGNGALLSGPSAPGSGPFPEAERRPGRRRSPSSACP